MTAIPKHERATRKGAKKPPTAVVDHNTPTVTVDVDMSGIEVALDKIAHSLKSYNVNACDGNFSLCLYTGEPLRLSLEGDAVDSIADSLKRIADAMTARK
jgi:hypothetical protein